MVECTCDWNLQNSPARSHTFACVRARLELAHLGIVHIRCAATEIKTRHLCIREAIVNVVEERQYHRSLLQKVFILSIKRRAHTGATFRACFLKNLITIRRRHIGAVETYPRMEKTVSEIVRIVVVDIPTSN